MNPLKAPHYLSIIFPISLVVTGLLSHPTIAQESLENEMREFFIKKLEFFHNMSKSKYLRSKKLRTSENYLRQILKKQQPFYSILRVNTKGIVANEVTRQDPELEEKYRTIADQKGFIKVVKTQKPYYGYIKNSNGRTYLMWIDPIFNSHKKFVGAVIVKVDIWDCIHEFSQNTDIHFLVKLGNKSLYSHKWKSPKAIRKKSLEIPGIKNALLFYKMPSNRSETGEWQTVKDTFTTYEEKEKSMPGMPIKTKAGSLDPLTNAEAKKATKNQKSVQQASKSQGNKILYIVIGIGLITLITAVFMIKKANQESDSVL